VKTFGASAVLKEIVCTPGRIDKDKLSNVVGDTETALQKVSRVWTEQLTFISLTQPGQSLTEPKRRVVTEIKNYVADAASKLEILSRRLSEFISFSLPQKERK